VRYHWAITPHLYLLAPHFINKPFQHFHMECLINNGSFMYNLIVNDAIDIKKVDEHCFHLGLWHPLLLWPVGILQSSLCGICPVGYVYSLTQNFIFTLICIMHSIFMCEQSWWRTVIWQTAVQWILNAAYSYFLYELCLLVSPNITNNSITRSPGSKLKMSLETYLSYLAFWIGEKEPFWGW
jgi:hypothetical protein